MKIQKKIQTEIMFRHLAKEFLDQRLGIEATQANIELLALYLAKFEKKVEANAKKHRSQRNKNAANDLLTLNFKEATIC